LLVLEFPSRTIQKKDPAKGEPGLLVSWSNLFVMMVTVMAMMMGGGIGRNHRTSQNHNGDYGKKNHAQFHAETPSGQPTSCVD
jgi:hypothetical protein